MSVCCTAGRCSPSRAVDGRIMCHGIIDPCQSAATSETVNRCCSSLVSSAIASTRTFTFTHPQTVSAEIKGSQAVMTWYYVICLCCSGFVADCFRRGWRYVASFVTPLFVFFVRVTLIKITNTPLDRSAMLDLS